MAAENAGGDSLWLRTDAGTWSRPEQCELLVGFAATLAEDLFRAARLQTVAIDAESPLPVRRVRDLELLLDRLAVARPLPEVPPLGDALSAKLNVMTFAPEGARGVAAYVDGQKAASI
jgi:hypothetical protein